jgi:NitT/TauT family transport system ATP-binding protein
MSARIFILSRRPATVKAVRDLRELKDLTPLQRRDHPSFHIHFNAVWKELDIHV